MISQHLLEIKRAKYNETKTTITLQIIFCGIILLVAYGLKVIENEWILSIRDYLKKDLEWQIIYEGLLNIKDNILYYIR